MTNDEISKKYYNLKQVEEMFNINRKLLLKKLQEDSCEFIELNNNVYIIKEYIDKLQEKIDNSYTLKEVAKELDISLDTAYNLHKRNIFPNHFKHIKANTILIPKQDLDSYKDYLNNYYTGEKVCEIFNITIHTLYNRIREGELEYIKHQQKYCIRKNQVDEIKQKIDNSYTLSEAAKQLNISKGRMDFLCYTCCIFPTKFKSIKNTVYIPKEDVKPCYEKYLKSIQAPKNIIQDYYTLEESSSILDVSKPNITKNIIKNLEKDSDDFIIHKRKYNIRKNIIDDTTLQENLTC